MATVALNPISYVTGTLGSGKSYYSMRRVREYLDAGKTVACNFDLTGDFWKTWASAGLKRRFMWTPEQQYNHARQMRLNAYRYYEMDDLYDFELPGDPDQEDRGLLVYDEAALGLNARTWQDRQTAAGKRHAGNKLKQLEFAINMRKLGWTMLIIAHSSSMLDNQIQVLGGAEVRLRNFARVKMPLIGVAMSKRPRFLAIHYWPEVRAITGREFYGLNISTAKHYRSMERFQADAPVTGIRLQSPPGSLAWPVTTFEEWTSRPLRGAARRDAIAHGAGVLGSEVGAGRSWDPDGGGSRGAGWGD